jgi:predicted RNA binding protein YcfA (HicA-like mRNA interferase family)
MGKVEKLIETILLGSSDANIDFDDLCGVLSELGFSKRQKGSHHIFSKSGVEELVNLQRDGSKAKPYQVRQVRTIIQRYSLWSRS